MGQVVNFHDSDNFPVVTPAPNFNVGDYYAVLFAGQGAYSDPGNNIWNGFADGYGPYGVGYQSTDVYSGSPGSGPWPEPPGNPGNPYAAYPAGLGWVTSDGTNLFDFSTGSLTNSGDSDSAGTWTPITLRVTGYFADASIPPITVPNGAPAFLFSSAAYVTTNGTFSTAVFTLQNVPSGQYGLYLYGAAPNNNGGTLFSLNSGSAHNGIAATLNSGVTGAPAQTYVEGENFVIFENVSPDASSNITITASPNPLNGVGNSNLVGNAYVNGFQLIFNPPPTAQGMTSAQNVYAGDTASFSFTPVFAASPIYRWQSVIGGVTNNLSDGGSISGSGTTNLTISGVAQANVGLYQCVITSGALKNTSPAAPLTILTSTATGQLVTGDPITVVGNILQAGDNVTDDSATFTNYIDVVAEVYDSVPAPFNMTYTNVEDNTLLQYVNLSSGGDTSSFSGPVGLIVTPLNGATIVTGMRLFASSSHPEDDPADYLLQGSTNGGTNFTTIAGGLLSLPAARNAASGPINITNQVLQEITFANSTAYTTYQLTFTNVVNDAVATNGLQLAELQLLGSFPALPPGIAQEPYAADALLAGTTLSASVIASGAGPLTYEWLYGTSTPVPNGTNATLTLSNVQTVNAGSYHCVITSPYGTTNTTTLVLTVVAPTAYEKAVLADAPICYYPLNETSGTLAYDLIEGNDGTYESNAVLGQPGIPDPPFLGFPDDLAFMVSGTAAGSWVSAPFGSLEGPGGQTIPNVTFTCWINPVGTINSSAGIIFTRGGATGGLDISPAGGDTAGMLGYVWNDNSGDTYEFQSFLSPPLGQWSFAVLTISPSQAVFYMLNANGRASSTNAIPQFNPLMGNDWRIGNDADGDPGRSFNGNIAAVAVFPSTLDQSQVNALYDAGAYAGTDVPPVVDVSTNPITVDAGVSTTIVSTILDGVAPFTYQWYYLVGVVSNSIAGATNGTLPLTNIQVIQGTYSYFVVVSNAYGSTVSSNATLNILSGLPVIVTNLEPTNISTVGATEVLSVAVTGTEPFTNSWTYNGHPLANGGSISGATTATLTISNVQLTDAGTYQFSVANLDGSVSSSNEVLLVITPSTYEAAVLADGPLAYWPLNETSGDTAFDIVSGYDGLYTNAPTLGVPGPSSYIPAGVGFDGMTQFVLIPDEPGLDFANAITLEAWVQPDTNQPSGTLADIIAKGYDGTLSGLQNDDEMQLRVQDSTYFDGGYYNADQGGGATDGGVVTTNWTHVVLTGDGVVWNLYQNGVLVGNSPDSVTLANFSDPWAIADGTASGNGRLYGGNISAVAIYDYALTPARVLAHYNLGAFGTTIVTVLPTLSVKRGTAGSVIVSWSASLSSSYVLQQSTLVNGPWSNVTIRPVVVGTENEVTLSPGTSTAFFRLKLQ